LLLGEEVAEIFLASLHETALCRFTEPSEPVCKPLIRRKVFREQMVGARRNHHLAEKFVFVLKMTVDRLHGYASGLRNPVDGCA
jgi:hypothetical protein